MSDGSNRRDSWAEYLRERTSRPKWSVARLGRESGVHRATIFKWLGSKGGVTVASVRAIAEALGDDVDVALRAAGGSLVQRGEQEDPDLADILHSGLPESVQRELVDQLETWRRRDAEQRREDLRRMIQLAGGEVA